MTREEAINVMRGWVLADKDREALETILPELKKDDRKRIKENCIHFLELQKSHHASTIEIDECIDWLKGLVPPKWLYRLEYKDGTCGLWYNGNGDWCFEEGIGSVEGCKTKDLPMDHDERYKQNGRDWFSSCSRKEDLLHWYSLKDAEELLKKGFIFTRYLATEYHEYENETVFIKDSVLVREEIDIFELFGKTKPMFKEGDWVVNERNGGTVHQIKSVISNVSNNKNAYDLTDGDYISTSSVGNYHLWTIKDAKPGNIIVEDSRYIAIYQNLTPTSKTTFRSFCFVDLDSNVFVDEGGSHNIKGSYPATKEQRDTLMKAMADAEYTFDFERKELKKIYQKPTEWSIFDYRTWQYIIADVLTKKEGIGQYLDNGFCKNIAKYMQEEWSKRLSTEQKPAEWGKEDETNASYICTALDCYYRLREERNNTNGQEDLDKARNWLYNKLKSLRPQSQFKPSDEQIRILELSIDYWKSNDVSVTTPLYNLLEQLKKLREE
jgi:hypothetical protein